MVESRGIGAYAFQERTVAMSKSGFDLVVEAIDANLDHLHKQRWAERAAELHEAEERAHGAERERAAQALRDHYANRFKPETSRDPLLEQARRNYQERQPA